MGEWEKAPNLVELDITATDLPQATIIDMLSRIPALSWLSAGQLDGMNDSVLTQWMNTGKTSTLRAIDLDSSDNITEDMLGKFLDRVGGQLEGLALSGMGHVTDTLWTATSTTPTPTTRTPQTPPTPAPPTTTPPRATAT